jgi:hypothetical protein
VKKLLVGLALALTIAVPVTASATPVVHGSFVSASMKAGQPHRVYVTVEAGQGSKTCDVTLRRRTIQVDLGTDKQGSGMFFFLFKSGALTALHQAQTAPSPTRRIVCTH